MAGKFPISNNDPGAIPRNFRDLEQQQRQLSASIHDSIARPLRYLSQGEGNAFNGESWYIYGTTKANGSLVMPFDPKYDVDMTVLVPDSKRFTATVSAWVVSGVNAYTLKSDQQSIEAALRIGTLVNAYTSATEPDITGWYGGAQIATRIWGDNNSIQIATSVSSAEFFTVTDDSDIVHIRTRRWYWPEFADANDNIIDGPPGSWYRGRVSDIRLQITPRYTK